MRRLVGVVLAVLAGPGQAQAPICSVPVADAPREANRVVRFEAGAEGRIEGRRGTLASSDRRDIFALDVGSGGGFRIEVEADNFDPAVELCAVRDGQAVRLGESLDGPRSLNPRLDTYLEAGRYLIVVKSEALAGPYALLVRQTGERPVDIRTFSALVPGRWEDGKIRANPDKAVTEKQAFRLQVRAGASYLVTARSDAFDTIVWVRDPAAGPGAPALAEDDDGWDDLNSALSFTARTSGDVIVEVGDNNGRGGAFRVMARELLAGGGAVEAVPQGGTVRLSAEDARAPLADGLPLTYRLFEVRGEAGERVRVEASADGVADDAVGTGGHGAWASADLVTDAFGGHV
jgi:hypothetical protein